MSRIYSLFLFLFISIIIVAQPTGGGPGGGGDPDVPIQGMGYLLIAGIAFGVKKILDARKK